MHFLAHQIDIIHLVPGKQSTGRLRGWTEPVAIQWELISLVIGFFQWELISKYPWLCMVFLCSLEFQFVTNSNFTCFDWNRSIFFGQGEFTQCCGTWILCLWFWSVKIHWISSNWGYSKLSFSGIVGVISCHISSNNWGNLRAMNPGFFRGLAAAVFASFRHESGRQLVARLGVVAFFKLWKIIGKDCIFLILQAWSDEASWYSHSKL